MKKLKNSFANFVKSSGQEKVKIIKKAARGANKDQKKLMQNPKCLTCGEEMPNWACACKYSKGLRRQRNIIDFLSGYDFKGLAEAYKQSETNLAAKEWQELFEIMKQRGQEETKEKILEGLKHIAQYHCQNDGPHYEVAAVLKLLREKSSIQSS